MRHDLTTAFCLFIAAILQGCAHPPIDRPAAGQGKTGMPEWLVDGLGGASLSRSRIRLTQQVRFDDREIEVCRIVRNIGDTRLILPPLDASTDSFGQFSTFTIDVRGNRWTDRPAGFFHDMSVPPPPPGPGGQLPGLTLKPQESFRNCIRFATPGHRSYHIVSTFQPLGYYMAQLHGADIEARALSNVCHISRRRIACDE